MSLWERVAAGRVGTIKYTYDVIDEALVPEEYKKCDAMKVHIAISKGIKDIPGLKIYEMAKPTTE